MLKLFVSDIHLCEKEPGVSRLFFSFLEKEAVKASELYILGDLFDAWAGDDDLSDPFNARVASSLKGLNIPVYLMHGNRDFLLGEKFFAASHARFIPEPALIELFGKKTLLLHGDSLCIRDTEYQAFRSAVRDGKWQDEFLSRSLSERKTLIAQLRSRSENEKQVKPMSIMDADADAVEKALADHACSDLIHGHTHLPGKHVHAGGQRWVLGDWHETGAVYLYADEKTTELRKFDNSR